MFIYLLWKIQVLFNLNENHKSSEKCKTIEKLTFY